MNLNLKLILIFFTCCIYYSLQYEDCCPHKSLGGHDYTLLKTDLALGVSHYCKNGCIYYRDDTGPEGSHWCFAPGDEKPQCRAAPQPNATFIQIKTSDDEWSACENCLKITIKSAQDQCDTEIIEKNLEVDSTETLSGSEVGQCSQERLKKKFMKFSIQGWVGWSKFSINDFL